MRAPASVAFVLAMVVPACSSPAGPDVTGLSATTTADETQDPGSVPSRASEQASAAADVPTADVAATDPVRSDPDVTEDDGDPDGPSALDFSARRLDGGTFDGVALAGRDVVLWMWAPWCPQCNREAPDVAAAVERFGDDVVLVGVAGHDTDDAHRAFVAEHELEGMVHLVDDDGSLWARFGIAYQPAWVFIDDDGTLQTVAGGLYDDLPGRLQALVDG